MKEPIQKLLAAALQELKERNAWTIDLPSAVQVDRARSAEHGDFASNIALTLAKSLRCKPRELAEQIVAALSPSPFLKKVEVAGPGFINFHLAASAYCEVVNTILDQGAHFGHTNTHRGKRVQVEFVSANPTGPLHVGHGRGAAFGATLANLLAATGYGVQREYYVNDAGRQMDILALSVWLRYLQALGHELTFPESGYQGRYVFDIASALKDQSGTRFAAAFNPWQAQTAGLPHDDPEALIDGQIDAAKRTLGEDDYRHIHNFGLQAILNDIREDLQAFGVTYDNWFSERSLVESNAVADTIEALKARDYIYEKDGAWWFRSTRFGDEKDRVVIRENGQYTYFASDIAYHKNKLDRGFETIVNIWGADHHGYIPRVKAAIAALGSNPDKLDILLVQFAVLYRGGEKLQMSTRSGEFVTLRELREEVGTDAARFFYVMRRAEQHLDFDLDLAKSRNLENPVYYIQYTHARVCSLFRQLKQKNHTWDSSLGRQHLPALTSEYAQQLMVNLSRFPEVITTAARNFEPHLVGYYLRDLAQSFHRFYDKEKVLGEDAALRNARLNLCAATGQVIRNGLELLGVSAPESM